MTSHAALYRWDEIPLEKVTDMVTRKVITGAQTALTQSYFKKGAVVPLHAHATEIIVYVLQGAIQVRPAEADVIVREGEVIVLAAGLPHQAESLDDTFVLTVIAQPVPPAPRP